MIWKVLGDVGQWLSLLFGISTAYLAITTGCSIPAWVVGVMGLTWGISTKVKYYGQRIVDKIMASKRRVTLYEYNEIKKENRS